MSDQKGAPWFGPRQANRFWRQIATVACGLTALGLQACAGAPLNVAASHDRLPLVEHVSPAGTPSKADQSAYLLVYFKDETHSIYFATSPDGYTFTDVNSGKPVLSGNDLAEQKGVRDPHIYRAPDGAFLMAMTDLNIAGQQAGVRKTAWERPEADYGWGNNKNLIFMKSYDLIHWTLSRVAVADKFPEAGDLGVAWAPETVFDADRGKVMVYFTTRIRNGPQYMVYAYADDAFTTLETAPRALFTYPKPGVGTIDGDITKVGDAYHLFYVAYDEPGHLRQAVSSKLSEGYAFNPQKIDPETVGTEAPNLWRRHGTDTYVLMYDVFGAQPRNNMGFSESTDFVHFKDLGRFNEPGSPMKTTNFANPKHGAVISITPAEAERLTAFFAGVH